MDTNPLFICTTSTELLSEIHSRDECGLMKQTGNKTAPQYAVVPFVRLDSSFGSVRRWRSIFRSSGSDNNTDCGVFRGASLTW